LDALYVNFISGFEMELAVAERLRAAFAGPLYADLHSLFLGCPGAGPRTPRPLAEWERWAACFDVVQINHDELRLLGLDGDDWSARLAPLLRAGPRMVAVTLGPGGAVVGTAAGNQPLARVYPTQLSAEGDPTGCGDIWGATFFLSLLGGRTVEQGVTRAHAAAARKLLHRGATGVYPHLAQPLG
jgi:sugar/nucleoside kinase (ribokinase family)